MAIGLPNYPNTEPTSSSYPDGNIKDDTGLDDGTPVDVIVYADMHQTLAKLLRVAGVAPNVLPENEYNGFQYLTALRYFIGSFGQLTSIDGPAASTVVDGAYDAHVVIFPTAQAGQIISLDVTASGFTNKVRILNLCGSNVQLYSANGYDFDGSPGPVNLGSGATVIEYTWNSGSTDWERTAIFIAPSIVP